MVVLTPYPEDTTDEFDNLETTEDWESLVAGTTPLFDINIDDDGANVVVVVAAVVATVAATVGSGDTMVLLLKLD